MAAFKKTLTLQNENCWNGGKFTSQFAMEKHLTTWRNSPDTPWLRDSPRSAQIKAIEDLDRTFKDFFEKRADIPCFKRKGQSADSFRSPDKKAITLDAANGRIKLPKLGWMPYRNSRVVLGDLRNVTVSNKGGKWHASILTQREVERPARQGPAVGIDVAIARFATLSDGSHGRLVAFFVTRPSTGTALFLRNLYKWITFRSASTCLYELVDI